MNVSENVFNRLNAICGRKSLSKTIELLLDTYDNTRELSLEEYVNREAPYIAHALNQPIIKADFNEVFKD